GAGDGAPSGACAHLDGSRNTNAAPCGCGRERSCARRSIRNAGRRARESMAGRLGSNFPPEGVEWWTKFMGRTPVSTQVGFMKTIACADIRGDVPKISCPTLVITTQGSGLASVDETEVSRECTIYANC